MDVERTIEFLIKNQARMDARMDARFTKAEERFARAEERSAKADLRMDRLERVVAQNNRIVAQLARHGVSLRSDVRRIDNALARVTESLSVTDSKLNALIDLVDQHLRGNGRKK